MGNQSSVHAAHLVDEIDVAVRGNDYKVQCWRSQGEAAVIVAMPAAADDDPPDMHSGAIANEGLRRLLGWNISTPFAYYEVSKPGGSWRVFNVAFGVIGHSLRAVLVSPKYRPVDIALLRRALGDNFLA